MSRQVVHWDSGHGHDPLYSKAQFCRNFSLKLDKKDIKPICIFFTSGLDQLKILGDIGGR